MPHEWYDRSMTAYEKRFTCKSSSSTCPTTGATDGRSDLIGERSVSVGEVSVHDAGEIHATRIRAREAILKHAPSLQFTETWFHLLNPSIIKIMRPPAIWYFMQVLQVALTVAVKGGNDQSEPSMLGDKQSSDFIYTVGHTLDITFGFLAFLYGFRTSAAYDRWWEGRKLWGAMVNRTRSAASHATAFIRNRERVHTIILNLIILAWSTKDDIRFEKLKKHEMVGLLDDAELEAHNACGHIPDLVKTAIRRTIEEEIVERGTRMRGSWDLLLGQDITGFFDYVGALERIAKTPMPFAHTAMLRFNLLLWMIMYTMYLAVLDGYFAILQMGLLSYVLLKIDEAAMDMENPFYKVGLCKLPLEAICVTIEKNLLEMLHWEEQLHDSGVITDTTVK